MPVARPEERGPVGDQAVEQLLPGVRLGKVGELPARAANPRQRRVRRGIRADRAQHLGGARRIIEIAQAQVHAALDQVYVRVLKGGEEHPAGEVHHFGVRPKDARREAVGADVDDPPAADGHGARPASGRVDRVDRAVPEHEVGRGTLGAPRWTSQATTVVSQAATRPRRITPPSTG